jgi:phosphoribosylformylglycinamidine cyclo-ligase
MNKKNRKKYLTYAESGVDEPKEQEAFSKISGFFKKTYSFREGIGSTSYNIGHFANVLNMENGLGLVLTTDGVGTKLLIAQMLNKFDTVGIDCIANNVNDILCMGAEPVAMLDYIAINTIDEKVLEDIVRGLYLGAKEAHISIPGGEIAQVPDMLSGPGNGVSLDLVGSAAGIVGLSSKRTDLLPLIDGTNVKPGDVLIGLPSSGMHSNGYSLARKVLLEQAKLKLDRYINELGKTLGEELLTPTYIYVDVMLSLLKKKIAIHGIVNVSGGGLLSLGRLPNNYSYVIDNLPTPPAIFNLIKEYGSLPDSVMFAAFNMGIGFCLVCAEEHVGEAVKDINANGHRPVILGNVAAEPGKKIFLETCQLVGTGETFRSK